MYLLVLYVCSSAIGTCNTSTATEAIASPPMPRFVCELLSEHIKDREPPPDQFYTWSCEPTGAPA